jgi:hypothetical protein
MAERKCSTCGICLAILQVLVLFALWSLPIQRFIMVGQCNQVGRSQHHRGQRTCRNKCIQKSLSACQGPVLIKGPPVAVRYHLPGGKWGQPKPPYWQGIEIDYLEINSDSNNGSGWHNAAQLIE